MTDTGQAVTLQTRKLPDGVIEARMGSLKVYVRESDKFFKVSLIAKGQKDWAHWSRSENAKRKIRKAKVRENREVIEQIDTGPVESRGIYAHYRVAIRFAEWVDPDYEELVEDVMLKFHTGDISLIPAIVQTHDEINDTTSKVLVSTVDNRVLESEQDKRLRTIERTKHTGEIMKSKKMKGAAFAIKNNLVNRAVWRFDKNTREFKVQKGIKDYLSPRDFAAPVQLDAISFCEAVFQAKIAQAPEGVTEAEILAELTAQSESIGAIVEGAGIHTVPLRRTPIQIEGKKVCESLRVEPGERPQDIRRLVGPPANPTPGRTFVPTQGDIQQFFSPRSGQAHVAA